MPDERARRVKHTFSAEGLPGGAARRRTNKKGPCRKRRGTLTVNKHIRARRGETRRSKARIPSSIAGLIGRRESSPRLCLRSRTGRQGLPCLQEPGPMAENRRRVKAFRAYGVTVGGDMSGSIPAGRRPRRPSGSRPGRDTPPQAIRQRAASVRQRPCAGPGDSARGPLRSPP